MRRHRFQMIRSHATVWLCTCILLTGFPAVALAESAESGAAADIGREVYLRHCARCHQRDGRGVEGLYPSLRDLDPAASSRREIIHGLLSGRAGALEINGGRYDNIMPTHGFLANETIAATLGYVFNAWSDNGLPVEPDEVAAARLELLSGHPAAIDAVTGESPLADMESAQYVTSAGPPMTVDEFERARRLYYGRCTGCHGVLRHGTAGNPLTPELMRERGTEYLQSVISFGSSRGMPGWGTSTTLSGEDINLLARFLQHPVPQPPDLDHYQIRDGWHQHRTPDERPRRPQHDFDIDDMFVVTLHDVGEIALLDGASKSLIARVPVSSAPHRVTASASGRYLYVIGRDGTVSMVDLYASPPERVASVRIGYEARALAASRVPPDDADYVLAGAYWPPQLVLLDGRTLEPLRVLSTRSYGAGNGGYHPEPRVSDIASSPTHREFISHIKETGHVYLFPYGGSGLLEIIDLETVPELRAGSFSSDGRYYLTPADSNAVTVLDVEQRAIVAEIPPRVFGGNAGVSYVDERLGPVWATTTMVTDELILIGTDPVNHADNAWRVLQQVTGPATGSLFLATHPSSPHLWIDTPLSADPEHSRSAAVFRKGALETGYQSLPVAEWSGLDSGPRRVIQPTFSSDGGEVWFAVWNPQDLGSAVVVVDDATLEPVAVIRRPDLITPTRIYSVASLRAAASVAPGPREDGVAPGAALYLANCANCHGTYGEGDGPMAPSLSVALKDLRHLSRRNDGVFPERFVRRTIDGRALTAAHRPDDMPVWGAAFATGAGPTAAEGKIDALVRFLREMQVER